MEAIQTKAGKKKENGETGDNDTRYGIEGYKVRKNGLRLMTSFQGGVLALHGIHVGERVQQTDM